MGLCYNIAFVFLFDKIYPEECEIECSAEIISLKKESNYKNRYIVKIIKNDNIKFSKSTNLIIYTSKNLELKQGEIVKINGSFEKASKSRNENGFNYYNYLKSKKIYGIIYSDSINKIKTKYDVYYISGVIKESLSNKINNFFIGNNNELLQGLLLGNKDELSDNMKTIFEQNSISHILAISGMHVTYIILLEKLIFEKLIKSKRKNDIICIVSLIIYAFITGSSPSVLRACIMNIIIICSSIFKRKTNIYVSLGLSFIIIILINPFYIYDSGMWLSFLGTSGIIFFSNFIKLIFKIINKFLISKFSKIHNNLLENKLLNLSENRDLNSIKKYGNKSLNLIKEYAVVSISAQIMVLPISIYIFNNVSILFLISNIFSSIIIGPIILIGYITLFFSYINIPISKILSKLENILINFFIIILNLFSKIPNTYFYLKTPSIISLIMYYLIIIILLMIIKKRKYSLIKILCSKKYIVKFIKKVRQFAMRMKFKRVIVYVVVICLINTLYTLNFDLKIHFLDVGQGDCTYIKTPKGKNILIDCGEGNSLKYDEGENVVFPYLLDKKINKIDYLVISHFDSDHVRRSIFYIKKYESKKCYYKQSI